VLHTAKIHRKKRYLVIAMTLHRRPVIQQVRCTIHLKRCYLFIAMTLHRRSVMHAAKFIKKHYFVIAMTLHRRPVIQQACCKIHVNFQEMLFIYFNFRSVVLS
jgi:hypothetical protein